MSKAIMVVQTNLTDDSRADEFNRWYNDTHLADIVDLPGVVAATRYEVQKIPVLRGSDPPTHRYLAIYEIEADDLVAVAKALSKAAPDWAMSEVLDLSGVKADFYRPVSPRVGN